MVFFEGLKSIVKQLNKRHKDKKEARNFSCLQSQGTSILQKTNWMDHSYMQRSSVKMERPGSVMSRINKSKTR